MAVENDISAIREWRSVAFVPEETGDFQVLEWTIRSVRHDRLTSQVVICPEHAKGISSLLQYRACIQICVRVKSDEHGFIHVQPEVCKSASEPRVCAK